MRLQVSKHSQDFENDERLHQMTTEFLDELVHNMSLLPAEHKAAAQLLQMMNNTKKDENQADVDLDILLAPHMVSVLQFSFLYTQKIGYSLENKISPRYV